MSNESTRQYFFSREERRLLDEAPGLSGPVEVFESGYYRWMEFGNGVVQSAIDLRDHTQLVLPYTRWCLAALPLIRLPRSLLVLGAGGGTLPRLAAHHGVRDIDMVDHDATVLEAANRWFGLASANVRTVRADARDFLLTCERDYDAVICDLFTQDGMPAWVGQEAFFHICADALSNDGVAVFNLAPLLRDEFDGLYPLIQTAFPNGTLQLHIPDTNNYIAFGFKSVPRHLDRRVLSRRAAKLGRCTKLPMVNYLNAIYAANRSRQGRLSLSHQPPT